MHRVALNGRFSGTPQPTGTQTAAYQMFDAIVREPRDMELVIFADSRFAGVRDWADVPLTRLVETPFQDRSRNSAHIWEQFELPMLARKFGCAVVHHPITTCSLWKNGRRSVVTLHDLNFYLHPEWYSKAFRLVYAICAVPGLKRAERVVTISNYVRGQASEHFHIRPERLRMIYNGVKTLRSGVPANQGGPRYLLCVGSLQPHKNLVRMIKAYQKIREGMPDLELHIVGRPQARFVGDPELPGLLSSPGVRLLGYLSEEGLAAAYAGAAVFCYPSLEEGFGLPVLEAMSLGTLVLTSNVSCLPEVSGPAELADPLSIDALAGAARKLLGLSAVERDARIEEGRKWAGKFTWQAAARSYLEIYREMLP
jgi:glycosyltransferase involved in cell wall biosynthesis